MQLYHFTSPAHLPKILREGQIKTTESNVGSPTPPPGFDPLHPVGEHVGPDVVWLLDTPEVEYAHGLINGINGKLKTIVRFTVEVPRPSQWIRWLPARQMHPRWRGAMIHTAGGQQAARHWWITQQPIPAAFWLAIDIRQPDDTWFTLPDSVKELVP